MPSDDRVERCMGCGGWAWADKPCPVCAQLRTTTHTRCRRCGGLDGQHGYVHIRYLQGGGGWNTPCPNGATA